MLGGKPGKYLSIKGDLYFKKRMSNSVSFCLEIKRTKETQAYTLDFTAQQGMAEG